MSDERPGVSKYSVIVLPTSVHTQCFREVADSIAWALAQLGHEVFRGPRIAPGTRGIVFGARPGEGPVLPPDAILYNGEQVGTAGAWPLLADLYSRHTVWDYSRQNAARYQDWGLSSPHVVRPGYASVLDGRIPMAREKPYDIVFFGSTNPRREFILRELEQGGISVLRVPFGVYGVERDKIIGQAKLCLNIHFYPDSAIFEAIRCSYLAQNGVPILSEISSGHEENQWSVMGVPYDDIARTARALAKGTMQPDLRLLSDTQALAARSVSLLDDVRAALEAENTNRGEILGSVTRDAGKPNTNEQLTLCMIVKNEAAIIERCLASVKPLLSRWCIVDTGSTDGTQDVIRRFMADVPGNLHERPWKEFDGSRTEAMDLARAECREQGWLLLIDADEYLEVEGVLRLPEGYDWYNGWFTRGKDGLRWARPLFLRANKPWVFEMPRHEGLCCKIITPAAPVPVPNALIVSTTEGARAKVGAYERYLNDAHVLEAWLAAHPGHARCQYYIAQSYREAANSKLPIDQQVMQKAVMHYLKRANMAGYDEETFSAIFQAANCMRDSGYPWERIQQTLMLAYNFRPQRAEPLLLIACHYREARQYVLAESFARRAATLPIPADTFGDMDRSVYEWRARDELAVALTYLRRHAEARDLWRQSLALPMLPLKERARIEANLATCIRVAGDT